MLAGRFTKSTCAFDQSSPEAACKRAGIMRSGRIECSSGRNISRQRMKDPCSGQRGRHTGYWKNCVELNGGGEVRMTE
jgi:hypothetical protein